MPNLAATLRDEIRRLARKELRTHRVSTVAAASDHRRMIAQLKRQVRDLQKAVAFLERQEKTRLARKPSPAQAEGARFSSKGLASHRSKAGLSARDYGRLLGVSGLTIYNWESGKTRPKAEHLAAVVDLRKVGKREALRRLALLGG
jgi:DNA-binding transcriptional regulator YiaG